MSFWETSNDLAAIFVQVAPGIAAAVILVAAIDLARTISTRIRRRKRERSGAAGGDVIFGDVWIDGVEIKTLDDARRAREALAQRMEETAQQSQDMMETVRRVLSELQEENRSLRAELEKERSKNRGVDQ